MICHYLVKSKTAERDPGTTSSGDLLRHRTEVHCNSNLRFVILKIATISRKYLANVNFQHHMDATASALVSHCIPPLKWRLWWWWWWWGHSEQLQKRHRNTVSDSIPRCPLHHLPSQQASSSSLSLSLSAASLWTLTGAEWPLQSCHIAGATEAEAEATLSLELLPFLGALWQSSRPSLTALNWCPVFSSSPN